VDRGIGHGAGAGERLKGHDVTVEEEDRVRYASELLRR
jgi:hypothetical protein